MPNGRYKVIALYGCRYFPDLAPFNPFSLIQALSSGCSLGNNDEIITLTKNDFTLAFDQKVQTTTVYVAAVGILLLEDNEVAANTSINGNEFHSLLGHVLEEKARAVVKKLWD